MVANSLSDDRLKKRDEEKEKFKAVEPIELKTDGHGRGKNWQEFKRNFLGALEHVNGTFLTMKASSEGTKPPGPPKHSSHRLAPWYLPGSRTLTALSSALAHPAGSPAS